MILKGKSNWVPPDLPKKMTNNQRKKGRAPCSGLRIWSWNVETLRRPGMLYMVVDWMQQHSVDITCFQETRWPGTVVFPLPHGFWFANIGGEETTDGVACVFAPKAYRAIEGIKFLSGRHMVVSLLCQGGSFILHNIHAPMNESNDERKNRFWSRLTTELSSTPKSPPLIVCGDFNVRWEAQLAHESSRWGRFVGGKGIENLTSRDLLDNRSRAWELLVSADLCDCGSFFRLPPSKTFSYREINTPVGSPPHASTHASLDRVCCRAHLRHQVKSVQVKPRVSAASHHMPVQFEVQIRVGPRKTEKNKKLDFFATTYWC